MVSIGLKTATEHQAAQDGSRMPSLIVVSGTAGTADTAGTAEIVRAGGNPTTGAQYIEIIAGTIGGGTISTQPSQYALQVDESGSGTTYVGEAVPASSTASAVWRIQKIIDTGGTQTVKTWADGNSNFDNIWTARGTMSFS